MQKLKKLLRIGWPVLVIAAMFGLGSFFTPTTIKDVISLPTPTPTPPVVLDPVLLQATAQALQTDLSNTNDAENHYQLGLLLVILDPQNAEAHLEQAAALDPGLAPNVGNLKNTLRLIAFSEDPAYNYILIGQSLASINEWRHAQVAFYYSTEYNPAYAEAWAFLGEAQQHNGEDALEALQTAYSLNPESFAVNIIFGNYYRRQDQPQFAIPYFETALELDPENPLVHEDLGNALGEAGNYEEAFTHFQFIIEQSPNDSRTWQVLAKFSIDHEVQVNTIGISAARQSIILDQESPAANTLLGRAYALQGDSFNAEKFFNRALELDEYYAPAHFQLGLLFINENDPEKARPHLLLAIEHAEEETTRQDAQNLLNKINL